VPLAPVTTVIFDVGNVLVHWDIRRLYASLIPDPAKLEHFVTHVVTPEWHFAHDEGARLADTIPARVAQFPEHRDLIEAYDPRWLETVGPDVPGVADIVAALDARGVPLFAITNFSAELWPRFVPTAPVIGYFRDVLVSGAHRLVKPDAAIYRLALDRFGVAPETALFIDDRQENIDGAVAVGMQGHLFRNAETLAAHLTELGLIG
jgi:2-haloacid dehalogenase